MTNDLLFVMSVAEWKGYLEESKVCRTRTSCEPFALGFPFGDGRRLKELGRAERPFA